MNQRLYMVLILASVLVTACGETSTTSDVLASGDLEAIRARKKELSEAQKALNQEITQLDGFIKNAEGSKNVPLVTAFEANRQKFEHYIELQGDVTTKQNVLIYPEAAGILIRVLVKEGQSVKKGELLATIDKGGMDSQLNQMKTQIALAKTTFERQERLWNQKIGTEIQYLQAKSNYESQESMIKQLESQLDKYKITAPFSGIIDDVIKDQGTVVAPGGPGSEVFRIINLSEMYLEVSVPESHIANVTKGKNVEVYFPVLNRSITSTVRQTGNFINPNNRSFTVEIPLPNSDNLIKPNMTAKVLINDYLNEQALLIPQSVISENAEGEQYVFVATDKNNESLANAQRKIIATGLTKGDNVEILSGIDNGDMIIQEGARSVRSGQQVKILTN
ncbi:MAG: efflux RND transporter periplasmic adaptor subunit [Cyclobacteriaceae bacterium]